MCSALEQRAADRQLQRLTHPPTSSGSGYQAQGYSQLMRPPPAAGSRATCPLHASLTETRPLLSALFHLSVLSTGVSITAWGMPLILRLWEVKFRPPPLVGVLWF